MGHHGDRVGFAPLLNGLIFSIKNGGVIVVTMTF